MKLNFVLVLEVILLMHLHRMINSTKVLYVC